MSPLGLSRTLVHHYIILSTAVFPTFVSGDENDAHPPLHDSHYVSMFDALFPGKRVMNSKGDLVGMDNTGMTGKQ